MRKFTSGIGWLLFIVSGIVTWLFMLVSFMAWWGGLVGLIASIILTPGFVVFPFVFWIVEGQFPVMYFAAYGVGIIGLVIAFSSRE